MRSATAAAPANFTCMPRTASNAERRHVGLRPFAVVSQGPELNVPHSPLISSGVAGRTSLSVLTHTLPLVGSTLRSYSWTCGGETPLCARPSPHEPPSPASHPIRPAPRTSRWSVERRQPPDFRRPPPRLGAPTGPPRSCPDRVRRTPRRCLDEPTAYAKVVAQSRSSLPLARRVDPSAPVPSVSIA